MKNLSTILNIVLLVAVAVLYYLYFSGGAPTSSAVSGGGVNLEDIKIAYVNSDSVVKYYDFIKSNQEVMDAKGKRLEQDFRNRATNLQNEITAYQRNASNMTIGQVRAVEEDLAKKQQNLQMFEQSITQELINDQNRINKELYDRITKFLKSYSEQTGIQVVLKFDPTSDLLYGGEVLDITQDVIKGLNDSYKAEKNPASSADSTAVKK